MSSFHDVFYNGPSQSVAVGSTAGVASTTPFGSQTRYIQFAHVNSAATVWYSTENSAAGSTNGAVLPANWVQIVKCNPGQRLYASSNTLPASTSVYVTELTD